MPERAMEGNVADAKQFSTAAIASLATGVLLCKFREMHDAAEFMMGHPIWTHHFASKALNQKIRAAIVAQFPEMPTHLEGVTRENYLERVAELEAKFGKTLTVAAGTGETAMSPFDGIPERLHDETIAGVAP
jgi:hypothetical protein